MVKVDESTHDEPVSATPRPQPLPVTALAEAIGTVQRGLDSKFRLIGRALYGVIGIAFTALLIVAVGLPIMLTQISSVRSAQRSGHDTLTAIQAEQADIQKLLQIVRDVTDPSSAIGKQQAATTQAVLKLAITCIVNELLVTSSPPRAARNPACAALLSP